MLRWSVRSYSHDDKGAVIPLVGLMLVLLVVIIGLAIDFGRVFLVRNKLQYATDAAVLAAADVASPSVFESNPELIQERANQFFEANFPNGFMNADITYLNGSDLITYNPDTGVVRSDVNVSIPLVFGGVYRLNANSDSTQYDNLDTFATSEVINDLGQGAFEVALAVDVSASMCNEFNTGLSWNNDPVPDPDCEKFQAVKNSINNIIIREFRDALITSNVDRSTGGGVYMSLIPFSHDVRLNGNNENFNYINLNANDAPLGIGLRSVDGRFRGQTLEETVNNITPPIEGGTNTAIGMWHAWAALDPDLTNLFTGESAHEDTSFHPAGYREIETLDVAKVAILLTDGENSYTNFDRNSSYPISGLEGGEPNQYTGATGFHFDPRVDQQFLDICQNMKDQEIILFTYGYNMPCDSNIATRLRQCASRPGNYRCVQDEAELALAFNDLVKSLIDLRITE